MGKLMNRENKISVNLRGKGNTEKNPFSLTLARSGSWSGCFPSIHKLGDAPDIERVASDQNYICIVINTSIA
jgi:hypothetical protein